MNGTEFLLCQKQCFVNLLGGLLKDNPAEETAMATRKIADTREPWEDGTLGREAKYLARAPLAAENDLDEALGLQPVSIRLPRQLIDQFKLIAHFHGVGYQPLMRDVLTRFVPGALQEILQAQQAQAQKAAQQAMPASKDRQVA
jgi:hypothetical protein